jgi:hemerythrin-like domain-containing protein
MDCLTLLKEQHDEAKQLFKQLDKAEGARASKLWNELKTKLTIHEELEERHFYPDLRNSETTEELTLEAYQEHHVMDVLIEEISALEPTDEEFRPKMTVLQENTEHHIEEEEQELFPKVRKIWNLDKRKQVGDKMEASKEELTRKQRAA